MSALFLKRRLMLEKTGNGSSILSSNQSPVNTLLLQQGNNRDDSRIHPRSSLGSTSTGSSSLPIKDGSRFPTLLFRMLQSESASNNGVVSWTPRGDSFTITDSEAFAALILPKYFGKTATKYRSFQRQMNLYGFSRNAAASKGGCANYHHPKFVRDRPELVREIQRKQEANAANGSSSSKDAKTKTRKNNNNNNSKKKVLKTKTSKLLEESEMSRRVSLDTAASQPPEAMEEVEDPIAAVVASYLAAKAKQTPQRRRHSSSTTSSGNAKNKQPKKAVDTLEDICNALLPPQEQRSTRDQDVDARQSLDEAFQVFLQEDDSWDLVQ